MAKKQSPPIGADGPPKKPKGFVLSVRGSDDWRTWLAGLADHERAGIPDVIDRALAKYAKEVGYEPPPPKR